MLGEISGSLIPIFDIDGYGYSALASTAILLGGNGRPYLSQIVPVIEFVDPSATSGLGDGIITIRGTGFIPLDTADIGNELSTGLIHIILFGF